MMLDPLAGEPLKLEPFGIRSISMESKDPVARHVFHPATSGTDRLHAWQEATGEPFFVWGTGATGANGLFFRQIKREFRNWLQKTRDAALTVDHDCMAADALWPLDRFDNKVLLQHGWFQRWEKNFEWMLRCTGKVLVGDPLLKCGVRDKFPWIPEKYIQSVMDPCFPSAMPEGGTGAKNRTGIWLHGLKWRRFGNRLRSIVDHWNEQAGELEILATGKAPSWAQKPFVHWSADMPVHFALMRIYTWDSCLLLNDYSLDQPWLMRALQLGCFPVVPEGSAHGLNPAWGEDSAPKPYEWGDIKGAMDLIQQWRKKRDSLHQPFQAWTESVVNRHDPARFAPEWKLAKEQLLQSRPPKLRPRRATGGFIPVAWYERVQRLRAGL